MAVGGFATLVTLCISVPSGALAGLPAGHLGRTAHTGHGDSFYRYSRFCLRWLLVAWPLADQRGRIHRHCELARPQVARVTRAEFAGSRNGLRGRRRDDGRETPPSCAINPADAVAAGHRYWPISSAILFESGLSFLGLGANYPQHGRSSSQQDYIMNSWWAVTFPGLTIFLVVLAIGLIGDGISDAFNPACGDAGAAAGRFPSRANHEKIRWRSGRFRWSSRRRWGSSGSSKPG